eukprot:Gregarina_sp_Poly_1__4259@NODE_231_length_11106_cov_68_912130_g204_i0_p8_GENE_NODE_231_length_11106_cov_68_912130_g204_i0NODE_231_length_11106_cov_68_912130_g204_i0_p8_ORF_typecomplete_len124_score11_75zf3CxxC_2/PF17180_4/5_5e03zf3CxxC_2/PF17180_4/2_5e11UPF0515/PF15135_6/0_096DiS_P_DiS/PF06750_13/0_86DiS_P_DiS/PF06750_13/2_1e02zf3CxxC/PF13695_6/1_6e03_NODE_231_length_11106_cov_68_912130_g204_i080548425
MPGSLAKTALIGAGLVASVAGVITAKKVYDKQSDLSDERKALLCPKPGQRLGHFVCACGKEWESAFAWVGEQQQCPSCNQWTDPRSLARLDEQTVQKLGNRRDVHDESRCTRCTKYQKRCYEL